MIRAKTFDATGIAPDGRLYAGDLNAIQDAAAGLMDLTQILGVATIEIGESGLQIVRYGVGEARLTGAFRTDGIIRALGGLILGAFTTTARNGIAVGFAPYGTVILNTTLNQMQWNAGTDVARNWEGISSIVQGTDAARIAATHVQGQFWFATDTSLVWYDDGAAWHQTGTSLTESAVTADTNRYGTHAARPAANTVNPGAIYWESDTGKAFRSDGANWIGPINPGAQLDYAQITSPLTSAVPSTEGTASTLIAGNSVTYDGSRIKIELNVPHIYNYAAMSYFEIFRDATGLGWQNEENDPADTKFYGVWFDTPAAGAHTYTAKYWASGSSTPSYGAGTGVAGQLTPAFMQVLKA